MQARAKNYDVIVIGGGASGMMAAGRAAERGRLVLLLEKNAKLGKKLDITGGGRCNITNAEFDVHALLKHYGKAKQFLYFPSSQFGVQSTFDFFAERGLALIVEARKRAFPVTQKASDVAKTLKSYLAEHGTEVLTGATVEKLNTTNGRITEIVTTKGTFTAHSFILATGGAPHPDTGSTGDAFNWLAPLGHTVIPSTPMLVPLRVRDAWVKKLAGTTLGNMKITFFACTIDAFPDTDFAELEKRVIAAIGANKNKDFKNVVDDIVPPGMGRSYMMLMQLPDTSLKAHSLTKEDRKRFVHLLKATPASIDGLMGYDRAIVSDGGVPLTEVDTRTMRSLKVPNLYLVGDVLHINRPSGGYSLQLCWTTGYVAGNSV